MQRPEQEPDQEPEPPLLLGGATVADLELVESQWSLKQPSNDRVEVVWRTKFAKSPSLRNVLSRRGNTALFMIGTLGVYAYFDRITRKNAEYLAKHSVYALTKTSLVQVFDGDASCFKNIKYMTVTLADFGGKQVHPPEKRNDVRHVARTQVRDVQYNGVYLVCDVGRSTAIDHVATFGGSDDPDSGAIDNDKVAFKFDPKSDDSEKLASALYNGITDPDAAWRRHTGVWW